MVYDQSNNPIPDRPETDWNDADTGWQDPGWFGWDGTYLTYLTCGLNSDETYRSLVGARGFCDDERWSGFTDYSRHCEGEGTTAWFQTEEGDTHAQGNIVSNIPSAAIEPFFSVEGSGGFPGVVSYHGRRANFGSGDTSTTEWLPQDAFVNLYDFAYFYRKFASPGDNIAVDTVSLGDLSEGVSYAGPDQNLTITGGSVSGGQQLMILVDGRVTITGNIDVGENDGSFLGVFASGRIEIAPDVVNLEGIYFTEDVIDTCLEDSCSQQLVGEGVFTAFDFSLERDLPDNIEPAETFVYRPDLVFSAPMDIWRTPQVWQELAP
jgi:hypothetical protein